ncbi:Uncharacterised protein [Catenibacterium mitsuokai]|nr:Uncharacterised protein [Catenibacterium mitsuokai]
MNSINISQKAKNKHLFEYPQSTGNDLREV